MEGRFLSMILVPNREAVLEIKKAEEAAAKAAAKAAEQQPAGAKPAAGE
jgi:hypothetical protein